jgi:hypothetical protein
MKKRFTVILLVSGLFAQAQIGVGTTTPNSTLDVRGALSLNFRVFTGTTTPISSTDNTVVFTGTAASTATLPDATTCIGRMYRIQNASTTSPTPLLTIATTAAQTLDGITTWVLDEGYGSVTIVSNGANWLINSQSVPLSSGSAWVQGGNSVSAIKKLGTITNFDLPFITNNTEKMRLTASGSLGIGTTTFNGTFPERLLVDAGAPGTAGNYQNVIVGKGNTNSYAQLNIQNINVGLSASSDVVATADNGSEVKYYIDMGINSSANTANFFGGVNDAYLLAQGDTAVANTTGGNLYIGTSLPSRDVAFLTGGGTKSSGATMNNERMRILSTGNVGIGTATPATALHLVKNNSGGSMLILQNTNASGYSSADFYSSANVLAGTFGYGNGSTVAPFTGRDYFNMYGNDFIFTNGSTSPFFIQGSTNNLGVNNTAPTEKLDVTGNLRFSGALMPNNLAGTAGYFLQSMGAGTAPVWFDANGFAWLLNGSTVGSIKKFGTIDAFDLPFITNNTEQMRITSTGNVGIGTSSPTALLHLKAGTATASTAPLKLTAGTHLTTPEAGAIEFDGVNTYITNETTAGRGAIPVEQHFLLSAGGTAISTIANYFGTTSNIPLVSGGYYEIEIDCYFLKTTAGTVTWTFTNSVAPASMDLHYDFSAATGIVTAPLATYVIGDQYNLTTTAPTAVSASLTTAVNHYAHFKIILLNGTGTSLKIQATCSAGTITPGIGSRWYCKRISTSNVGAFAN